MKKYLKILSYMSLIAICFSCASMRSEKKELFQEIIDARVDFASLQENLVFPEDLKGFCSEGRVVIEVLVGVNNEVIDYEIVESISSSLDTVAIEAIEKAKFYAGTVDGKPVENWLRIPLYFYDYSDEIEASFDDSSFYENLIYPEEACKESIDGTVHASVLVGENDDLLDVKIKDATSEIFIVPALNVIYNTKYKSKIKNGQPENTWLDIEVFNYDKRFEVDPSLDLGSLQRNIIYPEIARKASIEGKVIISVYLDTNGKVNKYFIRESSSGFLNKAAINAVYKASYSAGSIRGVPISCWIHVPIEFRLK